MNLCEEFIEIELLSEVKDNFSVSTDYLEKRPIYKGIGSAWASDLDHELNVVILFHLFAQHHTYL